MDIFSSQLVLHQALDYHMDRHGLLTSNVAHADTPGYVPRDLRRASASDGTFGVMLERTRSMHMTPSGGRSQSTGSVFEDLSAPMGMDGNRVSLDHEAAKLAANQSRYDVISAMMSAEYAQLAYAANDGAGA